MFAKQGGFANMAQPQMAPEEEVKVTSEASDGKREQSTIAFPYLDLDDAIEIAKAVHELHGSSCQMEQIAAHLKQSPASSTFRLKVGTAKIFGLVTTGQGMVTLTPLGSQICDPQQEKAAKVKAFLTVPLYKAVYEQFKGAVLPPTNGFEAALGTLGVAPKQKERARQILQRSAQEAGFFQFGTDRLVEPAIKASASAASTMTVDQESEQQSEPEAEKRRKSSRDSGGEDYHPFIQGLLRKLPQPDTDWPIEGRAKWLQAAINIFELMYTDSDESRRSISIDLKKDSAK
jgi:hypothetical protein